MLKIKKSKNYNFISIKKLILFLKIKYEILINSDPFIYYFQNLTNIFHSPIRTLHEQELRQ